MVRGAVLLWNEIPPAPFSKGGRHSGALLLPL